MIGKMAETDVRAVIAEIGKRDCPREGLAVLSARLRGLSERGETVPAALLAEQRRLVTECRAESQGR